MSVHISKAKAKPYQSYKNIWINQLLREGRKPEVRIICESSSPHSEEQYIQLYKHQGMILLNMTHNGKDLGPGGGRLISKPEIDNIRKNLGLPVTEPLF